MCCPRNLFDKITGGHEGSKQTINEQSSELLLSELSEAPVAKNIWNKQLVIINQTSSIRFMNLKIVLTTLRLVKLKYNNAKCIIK